MPKDDINYRFTENGIVYDFYDVFAPAELFRQPALWVWGFNNTGKLGINDNTNRNTPVTTFAGGSNWKQVAGHQNHTAAIKTDGSLWTWGFNSSGELGIDDTTTKLTPITTFAGGYDWKQVFCGRNHTVAIKTDGSLWTWGQASNGKLGDNQDTTNKLTPITTFAGGYDWKQVSCGDDHIAATKTDGSLWTWGQASNGKLGDNQDTTNKLTPITTFAGGYDWKQVSCGRFHTAAIKTDGSLWTWGTASLGRLGDNQDTTNKLTPITTFAGGNDWKQVDGGGGFTAAIKIDGSLWTWGLSSSGQLGDNQDTTNKLTPITTFAGGYDWKQVFALRAHTAAIKTNGSLWIWGDNGEGQLGIDDTTNRATPVPTFNQVNDWKQVGGEWDHTIAIRYQSDFGL